MEENKIERKKGNNTILVVIIILLVIAVGILIGYILVDKTKQSQPTTQEKAPTTEENKDVKEGEITSIKDYPSTDDNTFVAYKDLKRLLTEEEIRSGEESITRTYLNSKVQFDCTSKGEVYYDEHNYINACEGYKITLDEKVSYEIRNPYEIRGCESIHTIYKNDNYYILVSSDGCILREFIELYNNNGEKIHEVSHTTSSFLNQNDNTSYITKVTFKNNKMYFVEVEEQWENDEAALAFKEIDLSTPTIKERTIEEFRGTIWEK